MVPSTSTRRKQQGWRASPARTVTVLLLAAVVVGAAVWLLSDGNGRDQAVGEPVTRFMHLHGLGIPPWASDTVYVATHEGLIRIDPDHEWRAVSEQPHDFMGFAINPDVDGMLYTSGHPAPGARFDNPVGFMVSDDHGRTWTPRALHGETDFHAMAVQASDGDVVYGFHGGLLYRTVDGGETWETLDEATVVQEAGGALSLAVDPSDAETVLVATQAGLLRLTDDGRDASLLLDGPTTAVSSVGTDADRILAYVPAPGPGLVRSDDGGGSWQQLGFDVDEDAVGHIAVHPDEPDLVYVGTFGASLYRTVDGGRSWERLASEGVPEGA